MCLCLNVCFFFWAWGIFCLNVVEWISCTFSVYFTSPVGSWVWSWTLWSWSFTFCLLVSIYIISHPIPILTFFLLLWVHCPCFPYAFFGFVFFHLQPFYPFSSQVSLLKFSLILLNSIISLAAFFFCIDDFLCRSCIGLIFPLSIHFQAIDQFFLQEKFEMKYSSDILPISECCLSFLTFLVFSVVVYMSLGLYVFSWFWRFGGGGEFHQQLRPQGK